MKQQYDDTFLARWLAGELREKELRDFEKSDDFSKYSQIVEAMETVEMPSFDVEENLQKTLEKLPKRVEQKRRRVIPLWSYAAAASIAVIFFVYSFLFSTTSYVAGYAEQMKFDLPDGSKVTLNADSEVSFKKYGWEKKRSLNLLGEAFFNVEKGNVFTVETNEGTVKVLGTQFIVSSRDNFYNVICYEGSVEVSIQDKPSIVLKKGEAYSIAGEMEQSYKVESETPDWLSHKSSFDTVPILQVVEELERQFNLKIFGKEYLKNANFTGSFQHDNLEKALQIVFVAMDISYTKNANGDVVIKKD